MRLIPAGIALFPGSNCDRDLFYALEKFGFAPEFLWHAEKKELSDKQVIFLPGGFSYGDYLRPGAIAAVSPLMDAIREYALKGGTVIGICNGFQILTEARLLSGVLRGNQNQNFICRWVHIRPAAGRRGFLELLEDKVYRIPIAHADGNFYGPEKADYVPGFYYTDTWGNSSPQANPNGSQENIAGITNLQGNVIGLMPHPERAIHPYGGAQDGKDFFEALYRYLAA
ncbi:MAG: phosphoribosylformylglycinamidine synthase I [Bacteroidia bacterium]